MYICRHGRIVLSSLAYAQNQPHIILIMTDQQRGDAMGCMGNESVISPSGRFGKRKERCL